MEKRETEKEFITAFWQMYEKKPIEKISIGQLCQMAGYNRATFYNHFENIYDLLYRAVGNILSPVMNNVLLKDDFYALLQKNLMGNVLLAFFQEHDRYIELLFKRQDYHVLGEQVKNGFLMHISKSMIYNDDNMQELDILLEYQLSAVLGVINHWYRTGKKLPEEDVLKKIYDISTKGFLESFKAELEKRM